jgi:hypothetical protein
MRTWMTWLACAQVVAAVGFVALSLTRGQDRSLPGPAPFSTKDTPDSARSTAPREFRHLPTLQEQMYYSAKRGSEWLVRQSRTNGRFINGLIPDLATPLEGDSYLRQVGAAFALARAAQFFKEGHYAAVARQAVLTLLLDTDLDSQDAQVRHTTAPSLAVNRLGAAGLLVMAINELPSPGDDLLQQSEQLCAFIRKQQLEDGSLSYADADAQAGVDPDGVNLYPGLALYGLMCSQRHRPADWKIEVVRKALPVYRNWWRTHKSMTLVPWQTAAYVEAFRQSKDQAFTDFVVEMNDWLCDLQYVQLDPQHPLWSGGFREWADGQAKASPPQVSAAAYAESLAVAGAVAGEPTRVGRYREALQRCLQFLNTLQYTDANTQQFADWYRPVLLGAFHASHQDGNLRLDYTQHAVCALVQYLGTAAQ